MVANFIEAAPTAVAVAALLLALLAAVAATGPPGCRVLPELLEIVTSPPAGQGEHGVPYFSLASQLGADNATVVYFAPSWAADWGVPANVPAHIRMARSVDGISWTLAGQQATAPPLSPPNAQAYMMPLITPLHGGKELLLFNFFPASPTAGIGTWNGTAFDWPTTATELVPVYSEPEVEDGITHPAIQLRGGRLVHVGDYGLGVAAALSDDAGRSWRTGGSSSCHRYQYGCGGEPAAVELPNGTIWVLTRRNMVDWSPDQGEAVLWQTWSEDQGDSFLGGAQVPSQFISFNAPAMLLRLRRNLTRLGVWGDRPEPIVILYNNGRQLSRFDGGTPENARSLLHAAISLDGGASWRGHREVLRDPLLKSKAGEGERDHGVSYSQAVEQSDGSILIAAGQMAGHWGMARLDPLWLLQTQQSVDFRRLRSMPATSDFSGAFVSTCAYQSFGGFMPRGRVVYCDTCFSKECPRWNVSNPACLRQQNFEVLPVAFQAERGGPVYNIGGLGWRQDNGSRCECGTGCCGFDWLSLCGATVIVTKEEYRSYIHGGNLTCEIFRQLSGARAGANISETDCRKYDGVSLRLHEPVSLPPRTGESHTVPQTAEARRASLPRKTDRERVLCAALTGDATQATIQWNFPSADAGSLRMSLALEDSFDGALLSLSDHYAPPWDPRDLPLVSLFALKIGADGLVRMSNSSSGFGDPLVQMQPGGSFRTISWSWSTSNGTARLAADGDAKTDDNQPWHPAIMRQNNQGSVNYWSLQSLGPGGICVSTLHASRN